jgi:hypothetical protein
MRKELILIFAALSSPVAAQTKPFSVAEASISDMRTALQQKRTTSRELVLQYLARIALYEDKLHAVITVNPNALAIADSLDRERAPDRLPEDRRRPPLGIDGPIGPGVRGSEACHRLAEAPGPLVGGRDPQPRPFVGAAPRHRQAGDQRGQRTADDRPATAAEKEEQQCHRRAHLVAGCPESTTDDADQEDDAADRGAEVEGSLGSRLRRVPACRVCKDVPAAIRTAALKFRERRHRRCARPDERGRPRGLKRRRHLASSLRARSRRCYRVELVLRDPPLTRWEAVMRIRASGATATRV